MSDESKKKLVDLGDKYRIPLIEDDVFGECSYDNKRPRPAKYFDKKGNVMLCSSFSKSVAPGLRVGWVASGRYTERISELKLSSNLSTSPFNQLVMSRFLESHKFDKHISVLRRTLAHQTMRVRFAVKEHFPKGTSVTRPCGGFVLWVQLPVEYDSVAIQKQAYNESILIIRGTLFSTSGRFRNCLRLNCGYAWQDDLDVAIKRLGEIICNSIKLGK